MSVYLALAPYYSTLAFNVGASFVSSAQRIAAVNVAVPSGGSQLHPSCLLVVTTSGALEQPRVILLPIPVLLILVLLSVPRGFDDISFPLDGVVDGDLGFLDEARRRLVASWCR